MTNNGRYPDYPLFKGLQRPLELMGLQGRYIYWAAERKFHWKYHKDRERRPVKSQPEQPDFGHSDFRSLFQNTGESGCWFRSQQPASIRLAWSDRYRRNDTWADLHLLHFAGSAKR